MKYQKIFIENIQMTPCTTLKKKIHIAILKTKNVQHSLVTVDTLNFNGRNIYIFIRI